jgi:hypothetical protein
VNLAVTNQKYQFKIVEKQFHTRGEVFCIDIDGSFTRILYTHHALERIKHWEILPENVTETLLFPEEVVVGHRGRFIAHKRYGNHIIRAVYEYDVTLPVLITVYFPGYERYFEGGKKYADKIFKGI